MTSRHLVLATVLAAAPRFAWASPAPPEVAPVAPEVAPAPGPTLEPPRLEVTPRRAVLVTGAVLVLWGASELERATDDVASCRWCEPPAFDEWVRRQLRWSDPGAAGHASDVLLYGVMAGSAAAVAWLAATEGDGRELVEDLFLLGASIAAADALTRGVQHATGRTRPYALGAEGPLGERDLRSFFSGHTSLTFAAAAAATQVMRLRGRQGWEWIAAASFTAAAAAGWLRVASDQHWATDVLAGAAVGTTVGWAIPTFALRPVSRAGTLAVVPAPGGFAILF